MCFIFASPLVCIGAIILFVIIIASIWAVQRVPRWDITHSNVLLVGGSAGIGLEVAKYLSTRSAKRVCICARREAILKEAVNEIEQAAKAAASKTMISYLVMDVANADEVNATVEKYQKSLPQGEYINLLICNAGFAHPARFIDSSLQEAKRMMEVNYFGCLHLIWATLPTMLKHKNGRILLVSSLAAKAPVAGYSLYAPTKAAIRALAHSLDMENACLGVRVQVASPPDVETPGFEHENEVKSPECKAISEFGGEKPFSAAEMGEAIVNGIEKYTFDVTLGSSGMFVSYSSAAMEPPTSTFALLFQIFTSGLLRLGMVIFSKFHYQIVKDIRTKSEDKKLK